MHIVVEGQDGTGKDTQAKLIADYFRERGKETVYYAESGTASNDPFVTEIAKLNYGSSQDIDHRTRVLLYLINRYEQWRKLAEPTLKAGGVVVTARSWFSTLVYEGYAAGVSRTVITKLHKAMMPERYFKPDHQIILTLDERTQAMRLGLQVDENWDRRQEVWKAKGYEFQRKVNAGYLKIAKEFKVPMVDASGSITEVFEKIKEKLGL